MKCFDFASYHAASAGAHVDTSAAARHPHNTDLMKPPSLRHAQANTPGQSSKPFDYQPFLKETVRVDVDADADLRAPVECREPVADHVLDVEAAPGMDEQALAVAAAEHCEWGGGGAEYRHAFDLGRRMADAAR